MIAFLDFEASSLARHSYPIEVAWAWQNGRGEAHLIRPEPDWTDWDEAAERVHGLSRATLEADGEPAPAVAARLCEALDGHELCASAPSWDGKWLSVLLRAGGLPRHALRLRSTDEVLAEAARAVLKGRVPDAELDRRAWELVRITPAEPDGGRPAHRALPDAQEERARWLRVRDKADDLVRALAA